MARIELPRPEDIVSPPPLTPLVRTVTNRIELPIPTIPVPKVSNPVMDKAGQRESEQLMYERKWEEAVTEMPKPIKTAQDRFTVQRATWAPVEPESVSETPQNPFKGPSRNIPSIASLFAPDDNHPVTFRGGNTSSEVNSKYLIILTVSRHDDNIVGASIRGYYEGSRLSSMDHRNKIHQAVLNDMPWEDWGAK